MMHPSSSNMVGIPLLSLTLLSLWGAASCGQPSDESPAPMTADQVLESEEVIESLRTPLSALSKAVMNLQLPDAQSRYVFEPSVKVVDLAGPPSDPGEDILALGLQRRIWPVAEAPVDVSNGELSLWTRFLETVDFFHQAKFYNIRGNFQGADRFLYQTETGFEGLAQLNSGQLAAAEGMLTIDWVKQPADANVEGVVPWRVATVTTDDFRVTETDSPLFSDVGDVAFERDAAARLTNAARDERLIEMVLGVRFGDIDAEDVLDQVRAAAEEGTYPIVDANQASVVDINRDGFDDFYFTGFDDQALFFRNRGDGTFEEVSAELGLDFMRVHSATFADFDNDGDSDVFLSFFNREDATRYLRNDGGRFVDASELVEGGLPSWILSISVTDYNNDGLLDVYLGAFAGALLYYMEMANERAAADGETPSDKIPWLDEAASHEVFRRMRTDGHPISNHPGPPNWLLENVGGGRFRRAQNVDAVTIYYNTLGSAWSDIDRDGDMDLYVVNEAGPNQLVRNDGNGRFTDISNDTTSEIGFGMGVSIGDYDNDGRSDIYTTNMFSKAGLRIAEQMQSSEIVTQSARGNSLMRNTTEGFSKVSGMEPPALQVEAADFGWGGGFADLNNDGYLDIYVPAGFTSLPAEVATIGDS